MRYPQITQITQISAMGWIAVGYLKKSSQRQGGLVRAPTALSSQAKLHTIVSVERRAVGTRLRRPGEV